MGRVGRRGRAGHGGRGAAPRAATVPPPRRRRRRSTSSSPSAGQSKIPVIKVIRELTGLGLKEAKAVADEAPKAVKEGVAREEADQMKAKLEEAGATVEVKYAVERARGRVSGPAIPRTGRMCLWKQASCVLPYIGLREKADEAATQVTQVLFADPVDVAERDERLGAGHAGRRIRGLDARRGPR